MFIKKFICSYSVICVLILPFIFCEGNSADKKVHKIKSYRHYLDVDKKNEQHKEDDGGGDTGNGDQQEEIGILDDELLKYFSKHHKYHPTKKLKHEARKMRLRPSAVLPSTHDDNDDNTDKLYYEKKYFDYLPSETLNHSPESQESMTKHNHRERRDVQIASSNGNGNLPSRTPRFIIPQSQSLFPPFTSYAAHPYRPVYYVAQPSYFIPSYQYLPPVGFNYPNMQPHQGSPFKGPQYLPPHENTNKPNNNGGNFGTRFGDGDFIFPDDVDKFKKKVYEGNKFKPSGGGSSSNVPNKRPTTTTTKKPSIEHNSDYDDFDFDNFDNKLPPAKATTTTRKPPRTTPRPQPTTEKAKPSVNHVSDYDDFDFNNIQAPVRPMRPRPEPQPPQRRLTPGSCTWAIINCCSFNVFGYNERCFELNNCRGSLWGINPCSKRYVEAALTEVDRFYYSNAL